MTARRIAPIRLRPYDFHVYGSSPEGDVPADPIRVERHTCTGEDSAKNIGRKLARECQGPVDVAVAGPSPWADRYVGTASPRYPHTPSMATVWERLD